MKSNQLSKLIQSIRYPSPFAKVLLNLDDISADKIAEQLLKKCYVRLKVKK